MWIQTSLIRRLSNLNCTFKILKLKPMDQRIINLYDEYTHKPLSRNEFLQRLAKLTGGIAAATAILPLLEINYAKAATVREDDLFTERITYPGVNASMQAYVARPK